MTSRLQLHRPLQHLCQSHPPIAPAQDLLGVSVGIFNEMFTIFFALNKYTLLSNRLTNFLCNKRNASFLTC